ncbi:hypothetical protein HDU92_007711 [Lobulomyces angularis]|nr:hypothetical protein HDU92_007711 [Lobulomyces angularis]
MEKSTVKPKEKKYLQNLIASKSIKSATLHNKKPLFQHWYALPFSPVYVVWLYCYFFKMKEVSSELTTFSFIVVFAVNAIVYLSTHWAVSAKALLTCNVETDPYKASLIKIIPIEHNGQGEFCELKKHRVIYKEKEVLELFFFFQKRKFVYNSSSKLFEKLTYPSKQGLALKEFKYSLGLDTKEKIDTALDKFGKNMFDIPIPTFGALFKEQAVAPFFIFQLFCVSLWFLDDMMYYSLFTVFMLIVFESTMVFQRLKNLQEFRAMSIKPYPIYVYRCLKWTLVQTDELVPGDVCSVVRSADEDGSPVPCDMLVLQGSGIVNEAMLSGESTPQLKESIWHKEDDNKFDIESDKGSVLFAGTKVLQVTSPKYEKTDPEEILFVNQKLPKAPDNGCISYVLRTGFSTQQGKLVRMIIFSTERITANNLESLLFILFLMFFALIAAGYVWVEGVNNPKRKQSKVLLDCILIVTSVVPPELPMELSLAVNNSLIALAKGYVFCTEPFRIPFAGKIDVACFDKTGTLTVEDLIVEGVVGKVDAKEIENTLVVSDKVEKETAYVLASAHSLVFLTDVGDSSNTIIGDPMEKNTLESINWTLIKGDLVFPKKFEGSFKPSNNLKILRRFAFSSSLKRMSTICSVTEENKLHSKLFVSVKGAPETIEKMLCNVPKRYSETYKYWSRRGSRVLALAFKYIDEKPSRVHDLKRDDIESLLTFAGFLVFSCPLKPDSAKAIKELNNSSHRVVMITGDNALTASHVAKEVEIVKRNVLIGDVWDEEVGFEWRTVEEDVKFKIDPTSNIMDERLAKYDLCITGRGFAEVFEQECWYAYLLPRIWVYARVSPSQKESILTSLKQAGYHSLMCGDGTNDVGALKQSHVGIALLDGNVADLERLAKKQSIQRQQNMLEQQKKLRESWGIKEGKPGESTGNSALDKRRQQEEVMKQKLASMMEDMGDVPMLKFGDASVAAPFTSKLSSINSVLHIVRQGRSTLVAMIQMYKILALNCLISAYSMSVMYLAGIKQGDWQATIAGLMITVCFFGIAKSTAIETLSKKRPQSNVFNFYIMISVMGQAAIHVLSMSYIRYEAIRYSEEMEEEFDLDSAFQPNLLNSAVYLVNLIMQISTFAINYQGLPFRESLQQNKSLYYSLGGTSAIAILAATEWSPELNEWMQLVPFPEEFRQKLILTMVLDYSLAWVVEQICSYLFSDNKPKSSLLLN